MAALRANEMLPPSLAYLNDAAHLLSATAPGISAHLMLQRNALLFHNELELTDNQRQHVCGACGRIMVPGDGCTLRMGKSAPGPSSKRRRRPAPTSTQPPPPPPSSSAADPAAARLAKQLQCGACGRRTTIRAPPPAPISKARRSRLRGLKTHTPTTALQPTVAGSAGTGARLPSAAQAVTQPDTAEEADKPASANASSKKRAKSRKQGLQALLQQSAKSKPQTGLGLSLADFMKK